MTGWRSERTQSKNRWNQKQWDEWKSKQDWSPPRRQIKASWADEYEKQLEVIKGHYDGNDAAPTPAVPTKRALIHDFEKIEVKKQNAAKLKAALAYRATLSDNDGEVAESIDHKIRTYRMTAKTGTPPDKLMQQSMEALAEAQVRFARSTRHLQVSQDHNAKAEQEVKRCQDELNDLRSAASSPSSPSFAQSVVQDYALQLAGALTAMRTAAAFDETGRVILDPQMLDNLAGMVGSMASQTPPKTPQAPASVQSVDDSAMTEASDDYHTTAEEEEYFSDSAIAKYFAKIRRRASATTSKPTNKLVRAAAVDKPKPPRNRKKIVPILLSPVTEKKSPTVDLLDDGSLPGNSDADSSHL